MSEHDDKKPPPKTEKKIDTLVSLCRGIVVANLERYPPESLGILDEFEWEAIISLRHERTKPQKGKGGLDGTGRMNPAVGDKFMSEVEEAVPGFARSEIVDNLVWKDIVEFKFKAGGLARPKELTYPWPVLEAKVEASKQALLDAIRKWKAGEDNKTGNYLEAIKFLRDTPMNVALLSSSGIGKAVSKFLNKAPASVIDTPLLNSNPSLTKRDILQSTMKSWMALAADGGVKIKDGTISPERDSEVKKRRKNLEAAKSCRSWRELYAFLKEKHEKQRTSLGERMSQSRKQLNLVRPKIVKVRPASSRQQSILNGRRSMGGFAAASSPPGASKMLQLRQEATVTSMRRGLPTSAASASLRPASGFGAAVAFATTGNPSKKRKAPASTKVELAGGRRMKIPASKKANENMKRLAMLKKGPRPPVR